MKNSVFHDIAELEKKRFEERLGERIRALENKFEELYGHHPARNTSWQALMAALQEGFANRPEQLKERDEQKSFSPSKPWFISNRIAGMSLYVDRFCGTLSQLRDKLDYFETLGVNLLHLMPLFTSPPDESDGGYAVSDFRKVDPRFGTLEDLLQLQMEMQNREMYLMLDIVLNHTSHKHEWARRARQGEKTYQEYYYFFPDRTVPDELEKTMPEVFPESAPGNFTYVPEVNQWVMTVFHHYQWDLNYRNPMVLVEMIKNVLFYANIGADILRLDAPAFIWKEKGTNCQNLPEAHKILQIIKDCVQIVAPGMALLAEAIVAPHEIMKYFGNGNEECDLAYNATHMALQWDALATGDTNVMLAARSVLSQKPLGTSWINYTRCHDDIGLGYDDEMIRQAGYDPVLHRRFIRDYYSGKFPGSTAKGALFSVNEKTDDARISGTLASLCGLEYALDHQDKKEIDLAIRKIFLMQAHSFFLGGIPMIFYGDETGQLNDYHYRNEQDKNYDNRWMHRPVIQWNKIKNIHVEGTIENIIFYGTKKLITIRKNLPAFADSNNIHWLNTGSKHIAAYSRYAEESTVFCFFNFSNNENVISEKLFPGFGLQGKILFDHWSEQEFDLNNALRLLPYQFLVLTQK
ncbi:MAG: alpha-amylase family glycosyl hydrolase [Chitinophagaceae bacterium]|nr:alpha-amylase family glycosyl hydrolase [Chitinophagaceae bacterium]